MRMSVNIKHEGILSLVWVLLGEQCVRWVLLPMLSDSEDTFYGIFLVLFLWWGIGLILAVSALRRGSLLNRAFAVATILLFAYGFFCTIPEPS